jgi:hypothetical protein
MLKRFVSKIVDFAGRFPFVVLLLAIATIVGNYHVTRKLELRTDILELLPRDSPGFKAFEHQLGRVGGGASLLVIVESPERTANEKFIDDLSAHLQKMLDEQRACKDKGCPQLISYLELGTKDSRQFFEDHKWLYADLEDLQKADRTLERQIAIRSGTVEDLLDEEGDDDDDPKPAPAPSAPTPTLAPTTSAPPVASASAIAPAPTPAPTTSATAGHAPPKKKPALGMDSFRDRWKKKANKHDDFPTGYFATADGTMMGVRIVSQTTGTGDQLGDMLLKKIDELVKSMNLPSYHPKMEAGFAGDIPNAVAEKESLMSDAAVATGAALVLILFGVVVFFRSPWSLLVISIPAFLGASSAYAFATLTYGYVNSAGLFLGAIIIGNGINYPIVLLSRYREFRARGQSAEEARRNAVWNAFRAELVGAGVAGIAYGSLTITRFRGFSQFGTIGFVGMLLVWISIIPIVPATVVIIEKVQAMLPSWLRDPDPKISADGSKGLIMRGIAHVTEKHPRVFLGLALAISVVAVVKVPSFVRDPWEYNFDRLGSRGSKQSGAGVWSNKAEKVFGGKMNIAGALMLADTPEQVPIVKQAMLDNDAKDPEGKVIAEIATVQDLLPSGDQEKKLAILEQIRERLTPRVLYDMPDDERARIEEIKPPEGLKPITAKDLPPLFRRRFEENNGTVGTVFYVKFDNKLSLSDGRNALRIAKTTDNVVLPDKTVVQTASRSTIFAEMIRSMERDGPLASFASFAAVAVVVLVSTASKRGAASVLTVLLMGVLWLLGFAAFSDIKLNYVNFIALPITFGIGTEYPFNVFDRSRLLGGDTTLALKRTGGAVALCSFTTIVGYGSLLFNDFQALQTFGKLAMFGELACVGCAMFVLPSILHLWKYKPRPGETVAAEHAAGADHHDDPPAATPEAKSAE